MWSNLPINYKIFNEIDYIFWKVVYYYEFSVYTSLVPMKIILEQATLLTEQL